MAENPYVEMLEAARAEIAALNEVVNEEHFDKWCFDTLLYVGRRMLAEIYPPEIFDGSSGDLGPLYVVTLREAIKRIDEQRVVGQGAAACGKQEG